MSKPVMEFTISLNGEVTVETKNVVGTGCKAISKAYEEMLGIQIDEALKPEYYQHVPEAQAKVHI